MGGYGEIVHAVAFVIPREIGPAQTMGKLGWVRKSGFREECLSFLFAFEATRGWGTGIKADHGSGQNGFREGIFLK